VERPISLSAGRQTLCFDGVIPDDLDFPGQRLEE
jgi:hypothetical protein